MVRVTSESPLEPVDLAVSGVIGGFGKCTFGRYLTGVDGTISEFWFGEDSKGRGCSIWSVALGLGVQTLLFLPRRRGCGSVLGFTTAPVRM